LVIASADDVGQIAAGQIIYVSSLPRLWIAWTDGSHSDILDYRCCSK